MTIKKKFLMYTAAASALTLTLAGCGSIDEPTPGSASSDDSEAQEAGDDPLAAIAAEGVLSIGFAAERPFGYLDGNEPVGAAPDLHKAIWVEHGIENLEGSVVDFGALIPGLQAGQYDAIAAGMSITPERCAEAAFSEPEFVTPSAFLVATGNPLGLDSWAAAEAADVVVGVQNGAVEQAYADSLGIESQAFEDLNGAIDALRAGRIDTFAGMAITLRTTLETYDADDIEISEAFFPVVDGVEQIGAGATVFRKEDSALLDAYNKGLAELKESGEWLEILSTYGFTEEEMPPADLTTADLCNG